MDPHAKVEKDRRHSDDRANKKDSPAFPYQPLTPQVTIDRGTKQKISTEEIKKGYNAIGCSFYQIYHPSTQRNLQVHPENNSVDISEDHNNFGSKLFNLIK